MPPRLRTVSVGSITVLPMWSLTVGMRRLLKGDKATKNSVLSLFSFNILQVIQLWISLMHLVSLERAESIDKLLDGSKLMQS